jgi:hypothetical protein
MIYDFDRGVFGDFIRFEGFSRFKSCFGTPIKADSLLEIADKILSPTLSKGEGDAIRNVLVGLSGAIFGFHGF